jgi:hypothetical protein
MLAHAYGTGLSCSALSPSVLALRASIPCANDAANIRGDARAKPPAPQATKGPEPIELMSIDNVRGSIPPPPNVAALDSWKPGPVWAFFFLEHRDPLEGWRVSQ